MQRTTTVLHACALFGAGLFGCSSSDPPPVGQGREGTTTGSLTGGASASSGMAPGGGTAATSGTTGASPGTNTSGTGGPSTGMSPDGGGCEQRTLAADRTPPDMLIVLDRSHSMVDNDDDTDRWEGSVAAVNTVVAELEDVVRYGLMTFPGVGRGGDGRQCAPGMLDVPIGAFNAAPIAATLMGMQAEGRTPTAETLQQARQVLAETPPESGNGEIPVAASQYVLLVTDGDPNCMSDGGRGRGEDVVAQQATIEEVANLAGDGVRTYVIGFQTAGSDFAGVLDQMAAEGGTGDTAHRSVESGDELLAELRSLAGSAVSCSFVLSQNVDESRVEIRVDGVPAEYGAGWDIRDDQRTVDLLGATCDALQAGATVEAEVFCEPVNIL